MKTFNEEVKDERLRSREVFARRKKDETLEAVLSAWHEYVRRNPIPAEEISGLIKTFLGWLVDQRQVVTTADHRRALDILRAELEGDKSFFVELSDRKDGFIAALSDPQVGRMGDAILYKRALPADAKPGDVFVARLARPVCKGCGWTGEQREGERRFWFSIGHCSTCMQASPSR